MITNDIRTLISFDESKTLKLDKTTGEQKDANINNMIASWSKYSIYNHMGAKGLNIKMKEYERKQIIIYQDDEEVTRVSVWFADEDLWLTQKQLSDIYSTTQQNIGQNIDNIYKDGELNTEATYKNFL